MAEQALGDRTAASVREDEEAVELLAVLLELSARKVRKLVADAHGKTLIRTIFATRWPTDTDALGRLHVKLTREVGLVAEVAALIGWSERAVRSRLVEVHGGTLLMNAFADGWPVEDEQEEETDESDDFPALGGLTVADARDDEHVIDRIAQVTAYEPETVARLLRKAHGALHVRNLFDERWPLDAESLGNLRVKVARECGLFPEIAAVTHLEKETARAWLRDSAGHMLVRNLFKAVWPSWATFVTEDEDDDLDGADLSDDAEDDGNDEPGDEDDVLPVELLELDPEGGWSGARQLAHVLPLLGIDVPQRLHTARFREALRCLDEMGVEVCLVGEEEQGALPLDAGSPGIQAQVRLRRGNEDEPSAPRVIRVSRARREIASDAPTAPPPIVIVASSPRLPTASVIVREAAHDTALRRLQFLTAVPSMDRQHEAAWPDAFIEAAVAGLDLTAIEVKHLRMVAASFVKGHHSPSSFLNRLVKVEAPEDLDRLLQRFLELNQAMPELAAEVARWLTDQRGSFAVVARAPVPATAEETPHTESPTAPSPEPDAATNVRSLGALDDMFKD